MWIPLLAQCSPHSNLEFKTRAHRILLHPAYILARTAAEAASCAALEAASA
jgi:hypothetical protein